jgi:hypothetical protein
VPERGAPLAGRAVRVAEHQFGGPVLRCQPDRLGGRRDRVAVPAESGLRLREQPVRPLRVRRRLDRPPRRGQRIHRPAQAVVTQREQAPRLHRAGLLGKYRAQQRHRLFSAVDVE